MGAGAMVFMVGICGAAIEFSQIYNRKIDLYNVAKLAAVAAAAEVDGTSSGIDRAVAKAEAVVQQRRYAYGQQSHAWSDAAISFSDHPRSTSWVDASGAKSAPLRKYFVRVDTAAFGDESSILEPVLLRVMSQSFESLNLAEVAVAGRTSINVMPLAICAMSDVPGAPRTNTGTSGTSIELVEYGFRRGVSYDLMRLNPNGKQPENFVIDPYKGPGIPSGTSQTDATLVRPFVCSGKMWISGLMGGSVKVERPFPLAQLYQQLNSRFDMYEGPAPERCDPHGAPPDVNVKPFLVAAGVTWMKPVPSVQSPAETTEPDRLRNNADLIDMPTGSGADSYGPLWSYAKSVPYSAYSPGRPEPDGGYGTFSSSNWSALYKPAPVADAFPSPNPYMATSGKSVQSPDPARSQLAERGRRILNVPLLSCPVPTGAFATADVLAVARFFMTVPASQASIYAEFAGILPHQRLAGTVELFE